MDATTLEASERLLDQIVKEMRYAWRELPTDDFLELASAIAKLLSYS